MSDEGLEGDLAWRTWDGEPVSREAPHGVGIVAYRRSEGGPEFLILHRGHSGLGETGDWAWGPPGGARKPGEGIDACARRELLEETGLDATPTAVPFDDERFRVFAQAWPDDVEVRLSPEHDRYRWVSLEDALRLCRPTLVTEEIAAVARFLSLER